MRDQLSLTTVLMARERGLANVRVEDIVDRVGVSRRTFSNYFASKEEAVADRHRQRAAQAARVLSQRPPEEDLWQAVTAAVLQPYTAWSGARSPQPKEEQDSLLTALSDPAMQTAIARGSRLAAEEFAQAIAVRSGGDVNTDFYPRFIANAALSTALVTLEFWLNAQPPIELLPLMEGAFHQLGQGLNHQTGSGTT
ncbi:TetR/AcrR family transcriptional regulator [Mycolicibacterium helvum]|nr:TetR family transcriptional regulator [Mycolicibacterium helvum]